MSSSAQKDDEEVKELVPNGIRSAEENGMDNNDDDFWARATEGKTMNGQALMALGEKRNS